MATQNISIVPQFVDEALDEYKGNVLERFLAALLLAVLLLVNIALIGLKVADFPVRGMMAIFLLAGTVLIYPERVWRAIEQHSLLLWLTAALAVLGTFVSFANGAAASLVFTGIMEVPLQVAVTLIVASVLVQIAGYRAGIAVIVAIIGGSTLVALMQFLGIEAAWNLREWLGSIQKESLSAPIINRRPMGISYSPIHLSTQLCLAFAVFAATRDLYRDTPNKKAPADPMVLVAVLLLVVGSLLTLTRSPILGAAVFAALYMLRRPGSWLLFVGLLGAVGLYLIGPYILDLVQDNAPRIVRADDGSVKARLSMNTYGLMLFADNPLGYGYTFTPSDHWTKFWQSLYQTPGASAVTDKELHNYVLNMLNTYGIGLLLILPIVIALLIRGRYALLFFIPYIVHILFHNSGPFWTDVPFWIGISVVSAAFAAKPAGNVNDGHRIETDGLRQRRPRSRLAT